MPLRLSDRGTPGDGPVKIDPRIPVDCNSAEWAFILAIGKRVRTTLQKEVVILNRTEEKQLKKGRGSLVRT